MIRGVALLATLIACVGACGAANGPSSYGWFGDVRDAPVAGNQGMRLAWTERLTGDFDSSYTPVEHASAGVDPRRERIYVGSSRGDFYGFDGRTGERVFRYAPGSGVEAAPAVDPRWGDIYLASEDGVVHALEWRSGNVKWKESAPGPVRQAPVLTEDAVFVVTESDEVVAFSREDGEILWTHRRDVDLEIAIVGHSGITLHDGVLYVGFTDGMVVALREGDGSVVWERPTQLDVEESDEPYTFYDADATPVLVEDVLYAASFTAGIYALDARNGSVHWREPIEGVTSLASVGRYLIAASASEGLVAFDRNTRERVWDRPARGAAGQPVVTPRGTLLVPESTGALLALDLRSGRELSRLEGGHGFSAAPTVVGRYGWILSNGGTLLAFSL